MDHGQAYKYTKYIINKCLFIIKSIVCKERYRINKHPFGYAAVLYCLFPLISYPTQADFLPNGNNHPAFWLMSHGCLFQ